VVGVMVCKEQHGTDCPPLYMGLVFLVPVVREYDRRRTLALHRTAGAAGELRPRWPSN
jgi:hypothetical protein